MTDFKIVVKMRSQRTMLVKQRLRSKSENENESEGQESPFFLYYLLK